MRCDTNSSVDACLGIAIAVRGATAYVLHTVNGTNDYVHYLQEAGNSVSSCTEPVNQAWRLYNTWYVPSND